MIAMAVYTGSDEIGTIMAGNDEIVQIYVGEDLVYQAVEDPSSQDNP